MDSFVSEYKQVIDSKNRVFIPAKYREIVGDKVYITPNVDGCLSLYSEEGWKEYSDRLMALPSSEGSKLTRFIFSAAMEAKPDSQGRVVLTPTLCEYASLKKDIYFVGNGNHAEIWDKDKRDADKNMDDLKAFMEIMKQNKL